MSLLDLYIRKVAHATSAPSKRPILSIDFETFSEIDLKKTGASVYARHPSTEVLMCAYAAGRSEVKLWVPAEGEPMPDDLRRCLEDPSITIGAWNAAFEANILRHTLGIDLPPERFLDTMVLAFSLSLPGSLDKCGEVVGLAENKKKLSRGKALIRRFCVPRKPTKYLPHTRATHLTDPKEWDEFKLYCRMDVEAERSIYRRIKKYQMPDHEWKLWALDQKINDAGIPINLAAVRKAVQIYKRTVTRDLDEMAEITGLANPNSGAQLLPWLKARGYPYLDLKKGHIERAEKDTRDLLDEDPEMAAMLGLTEELHRVLELRLRVSKSSVKKFPALLEATDTDGNLRGCHQFAGAARTWRWCLPADAPVTVLHPDGRIEDVPIVEVGLSDLVWDGEQWVAHEGVVYNGVRKTIKHDGIIATPQHKVFINSWLQVPLSVADALDMEVWRGEEPVYHLPADFPLGEGVYRSHEERPQGTLAVALLEGEVLRQAAPAVGLYPEARPGGVRDGGSGDRADQAGGEGGGGPLDCGPLPRDEHFPRRGRGRGHSDACLLGGHALGPGGARSVHPEALENARRADVGVPGVARRAQGGRGSLARAEPKGSVLVRSSRSSARYARESGSPWALGALRPPVREIRRAALHRLCEGAEGAGQLAQADRCSAPVGGAGSVFAQYGHLFEDQGELGGEVGNGEGIPPCATGARPSEDGGRVQSGPRSPRASETEAPRGHRPVLGRAPCPEGEPTYDIVNAGPRNRFRAYGRIVSNSGRRFQPQNLSKPSKSIEKFLIGLTAERDENGDRRDSLERVKEAFGNLVRDIERLTVEEFWAKYDRPDIRGVNTMEALVAAVRPMVQAPEGMVLVDADLSAIENVGLGWLADDDKILRVFRNDLDPYIDFAQDMFKMSYADIKARVDAGDKSMRTTAKPGVLGCFAAETPVLTPSGWKPIARLTTDDLVFDGDAWVRHDGVVEMGHREVVEFAGVRATPDHKFLTQEGWAEWQNVLATSKFESAINLARGKLSAPPPSAAPAGPTAAAASAASSGKSRAETLCAGSPPAAPDALLLIAAPRSGSGSARSFTTYSRIVSTLRAAGAGTRGMQNTPTTEPAGSSAGSRTPTSGSATSWANSGRTEPLKSTGSTTTGTTSAETSAWRTAAFKTQIAMTVTESNTRAGGTRQRSSIACSPLSTKTQAPSPGRLGRGCPPPKSSPTKRDAEAPMTYDVVNAGPNHRFVILSEDGPLIAHNCGYALGAGEARENPQTGEIEATGLLGYAWGMGVDLTPEMAKLSVDTFRAKFEDVVKFWADMDKACRRAIASGKPQRVRYLTVDIKGPFMRIGLPSGRHLHYWKPRLERRKMPWKDRDGRPVYRESITYEQMEAGQWRRVTTHPGKLAENCFAGDTPVLTQRGAVPIASIRDDDLVWDGVEWVSHGGVVAKGVREVIDFGGVRVTEDHRIWIEGEWHGAGACEHHEAASSYARHFWGATRDAYRAELGRFGREELVLERPVRLWRDRSSDSRGLPQEPVLRLRSTGLDLAVADDARDVEAPSFRGLAQHDRPLHAPDAPSVGELRRSGNHGLPGVAGLVRGVLGGHGSDVPGGAGLGSRGQHAGLQPGELPLGYAQGELPEQALQPPHLDSLGGDDSSGGIGTVWDRRDHAAVSAGGGGDWRRPVSSAGREEQVYDLLNCGPRSRFAVVAPDGMFLAHNCTQAVARDFLAHGMTLADSRGLDLRLHVHDQAVALAPARDAERQLKALIDCLTTIPRWANRKLPLKAAGMTTPVFVKD